MADYALPVDEIWERIEAELLRRNKPQKWLAEQLDCSPQVINNWKRDGVPSSRYYDIATAFDDTVEWLVGRAPPRREQLAPASPMAQRIGREFETIQDTHRQLAAFAEIIAVIERARSR